MKIAVLSGKGGTGKTLTAVNLAAAAEQAIYVDCDVEEPNGHLFFKPEAIEQESVTVKMPAVDTGRCIGCRACVDFCRFNAMAFIGEAPIVFEDVCHSCGGCARVCDEGAIEEYDKTIGTIDSGTVKNITILSGILNIGEPSGVPIIKRLLNMNRRIGDEITVVDCPPGSACTVIESIKDADYCVLVTEPTVFGAHNLEMVHKLVKRFKKPFGAVLNKTMNGYNPSEVFCEDKGIPVLGRIPFDKTLGKLNSDAKVAVWEKPSYQALFQSLLNKILETGKS